jgi:hypothetical protein
MAPSAGLAWSMQSATAARGGGATASGLLITRWGNAGTFLGTAAVAGAGAVIALARRRPR